MIDVGAARMETVGAVVIGVEPLATLKSYRLNAPLRGVMFGQNAIIVRGVGAMLREGQKLEVAWK